MRERGTWPSKRWRFSAASRTHRASSFIGKPSFVVFVAYRAGLSRPLLSALARNRPLFSLGGSMHRARRTRHLSVPYLVWMLCACTDRSFFRLHRPPIGAYVLYSSFSWRLYPADSLQPSCALTSAVLSHYLMFLGSRFRVCFLVCELCVCGTRQLMR